MNWCSDDMTNIPIRLHISPQKSGVFGVLEMLTFRMLKNEAFHTTGYDLHVHSPLFKNEKYLEVGGVIPQSILFIVCRPDDIITRDFGHGWIRMNKILSF